MRYLLGMLFVSVTIVTAQTKTDTQFPFGLREKMKATDVINAAKQNGLEPVTRIDEIDMKSVTIHPRNTKLGNQNVDCYHTEFFRDQLWGVNVMLEGSGDATAHHRNLQDIISFVKATYPGNVTSCRLDKLKPGKDRMFSYVLEMRYGTLLVTVISDYDTITAKYSAAVTYTRMNQGRYQARNTM
jgi:hypothetical protein